jgi:hypothetical protein
MKMITNKQIEEIKNYLYKDFKHFIEDENYHNRKEELSQDIGSNNAIEFVCNLLGITIDRNYTEEIKASDFLNGIHDNKRSTKKERNS